MGYATREELLAFLNELLEAERAGARVAARMVSEIADTNTKAVMRDVHHDEARWCAMLLKWIHQLGRLRRAPVRFTKMHGHSGRCRTNCFSEPGQGWWCASCATCFPKFAMTRCMPISMTC